MIWRLADELRGRIHLLTDTPDFRREAWLQGQLRRAAQSACANIAEGFGRYHPRDFARFVRTARGSLEEVKAHLDQAQLLSLLSAPNAKDARSLASRACGAATNLIRYLEHADTP